jgi:hypothetical protein
VAWYVDKFPCVCKNQDVNNIKCKLPRSKEFAIFGTAPHAPVGRTLRRMKIAMRSVGAADGPGSATRTYADHIIFCQRLSAHVSVRQRSILEADDSEESESLIRNGGIEESS